MRLKSIRIEGMHKVIDKTYHFDRLNYLFGKNGAGKSTALQAIQLALLGYIPGCNKTNAAIFTHARSKALAVTATLDDNGTEITIVRTWNSSGSSVSSSTSVTPEGYDIESIISELELPIYNFNDFVGLTANQLKNWFIQFLPNEDGDVVWEEELQKSLGDKVVIDEALTDTVLASIQVLASQHSGVELVREVNAMLKEKLSFEKGQLERLQGTIQSLIFYDDCEEDVDISSLKSELEAAINLRYALKEYNASLAANEALQSMLDAIKVAAQTAEEDPQYIAAVEESNKYKEQAQALITEATELLDEKKALEEEEKQILTVASELYQKYSALSTKSATLSADIAAKEKVASGDGTCPYTHTVCQSVKAMFNEINAEVSSLKQDLAALNAEVTEAKAQYEDKKKEAERKQAEAAGLLRQSEAKSAQSSQCIRDAEAALREADGVKQKYAQRAEIQIKLAANLVSAVPPTSKSDEELAQEAALLTDKIAHAEANKKYNELTGNLTKEKYKIESTIEALKVWIKLTDANGMQTTMMEAPFKGLSGDMTHYLKIMFASKDVEAAFHLSDKANSFSFGWIEDDKYIPFEGLSSGEKCLYTIALMMCITARSKSALKLILIDDLLDHLDDENAAAMFESLYNVSDIQFVLAGVQKCDGFEHANEILINVKRE